MRSTLNLSKLEDTARDEVINSDYMLGRINLFYLLANIVEGEALSVQTNLNLLASGGKTELALAITRKQIKKGLELAHNANRCAFNIQNVAYKMLSYSDERVERYGDASDELDELLQDSISEYKDPLLRMFVKLHNIEVLSDLMRKMVLEILSYSNKRIMNRTPNLLKREEFSEKPKMDILTKASNALKIFRESLLDRKMRSSFEERAVNLESSIRHWANLKPTEINAPEKPTKTRARIYYR